MHEAAITEALIEQVQSLLPGGARLLSCQIDVGELEHLDSLVMDTVWRAMTASTPLEGAELVIERVPVRVRCALCSGEFEPGDPAVLMCPACNVVRPELLSGAGVFLKSLEVNDDD